MKLTIPIRGRWPTVDHAAREIRRLMEYHTSTKLRLKSYFKNNKTRTIELEYEWAESPLAES